jgi:hypothetical protein
MDVMGMVDAVIVSKEKPADHDSGAGVSSIRSKQGVFLIFSQGWIWARGLLPDREFDLA